MKPDAGAANTFPPVSIIVHVIEFFQALLFAPDVQVHPPLCRTRQSLWAIVKLSKISFPVI
jgi:hypothetical protein